MIHLRSAQTVKKLPSQKFRREGKCETTCTGGAIALPVFLTVKEPAQPKITEGRIVWGCLKTIFQNRSRQPIFLARAKEKATNYTPKTVHKTRGAHDLENLNTAVAHGLAINILVGMFKNIRIVAILLFFISS